MKRQLYCLLILMSTFSLAGCATTTLKPKNDYGVPTPEWQKLSQENQQLIKQSHTNLDFNQEEIKNNDLSPSSSTTTTH